ncbi:MAG: glycosyltransferase family 39 protein [Paracoccaceae bacterium]
MATAPGSGTISLRQIPRRDFLVLLAILVAAAILRVVGLDAPLWHDEILTLTRHVRLPWSDMLSTYSMNFHYLFSMQAKAAVSAFGETPWALRLPAVVFGVAGIAAVWVLARIHVGTAQAHAAALLLALSFHHIWFSQNARGYTELMFWSTLGTILFLAGLERPGFRIWAAFGVTLALAVFTHLTGAFFFLALAIVGLIRLAVLASQGRALRADLLMPLAGFLIGGVLSLVFYAPVLPGVIENAMTVSQTSAVDPMKEYQNPLWTVVEAVRTLIGDTGGLALLVGALVAALLVVGSAGLASRVPLLAPVAFTHIVLTMALLSALGMRIWPRFFFVDIGLLMLLIVQGVHVCCVPLAALARRVLGGWWTAGRLFAVAALAMLAISAALAARNYRAPKQNLAGAWALVEAQRRPDDKVLILGVVDVDYRSYFGADWTPVPEGADLARQMSATGRTWIVMGFPGRTFRQYARELPFIERQFRLAKEFPGTLGDGNVLVYVTR